MTYEQSGRTPLGRRPALKLLAGGAAAVAGIGVGVGRLSDSDRSDEDLPTLQLSSHGGSGVDSLDILLDSRQLTALGGGRWQTKQLPTSTHSMVALTWTRASQCPPFASGPESVGSGRDGRHSPPLQDLPDLDAEERTAVAGTDLVWIGAADGIQVDVSGDRPEGLTLVLLHPAQDLGLARIAPRTSLRGEEQTQERAPRPELRGRRDWGAERSWRSGEP